MEIKKMFDTNQIMMTIGFILMGILGRYALVSMGAPPNIEIILVLTFLAALFLRSPFALLVPLCSMIGSDLLLGNAIFVGDQMNRIILFTYSGFAMIAVINILNRERFRNSLSTIKLKSIGITAGLGVGFVLIYDVWTNLGWWYLIYPHTLGNLAAVFAAGIPFMINHLVSGVATFVLIALPFIVYLSRAHKIQIPIRIKTIHKIPIVAIVLCLMVLSFTGTAMQVPQKSGIWLEKSEKTSVTIAIQGEGWAVTDHVVAYNGDTAFSVVKRCAERNALVFKSTYYASFDSTLIDQIGDTVNGHNGKYWQYYVNGDLPMVGCDKYTVSNGDSMVWRFESVPNE